jgi:hypothetical protein
VSTQTVTSSTAEQERIGAEKVRQLRELFADAPELGKEALENALVRRPSRSDGRGLHRLERVGKAVDELLDKVS